MDWWDGDKIGGDISVTAEGRINESGCRVIWGRIGNTWQDVGVVGIRNRNVHYDWWQMKSSQIRECHGCFDLWTVSKTGDVGLLRGTTMGGRDINIFIRDLRSIEPLKIAFNFIGDSE